MTTDVVVVGAGPGGSWAGYRLARGGARVVLVDPSHPREKPCGGGVTGRALAIVAGAIDAAALPAVRVRAARFLQARTDVSATVPLQADARGGALLVTAREKFDGALLDAATRAGAAWQPARAVAVEQADAGWRIRLDNGRAIDAPFIVGADGANSLVRRRVASPFTRAQLSIATGWFAHGVTSDEIAVEFVGDPPGYLWSFPRPDHLAIGVCAGAGEGATAGQLRERTLAWMRATGIGVGGRLQPYSWPIPSLPAADYDRLPVAGAGWCLVGDAAGLVDPITREGIFFALQSADFAADALLADRASCAKRYTARVQDAIISELVRAARLRHRFFSPRFTHLLMDALAGSDRIRAVMADLVAGTQGYRDLKWRLAKTLELGYALKVLRASLQGA